MTDLILQFLGFHAALAIFWRGESLLNLMSPGCRMAVRVAFWMVVVGAASLAVRIVQGYVPPASIVTILWGMALLLLSERRVRAILRIHAPDLTNKRSTP